MADTSTPTSKTMRWALIASLAVNLAVAGLALGIYLRNSPGAHGEPVRDLGFGPYDGALRPQDRDALRQAMKAKSAALKETRGQMSADTTVVIAALRATPFDADALGAALAAQQSHLSDRMKLGTDTMRDFLANLPPQDRLAFADRLEDRLKRGKGAPSPN